MPFNATTVPALSNILSNIVPQGRSPDSLHLVYRPTDGNVRAIHSGLGGILKTADNREFTEFLRLSVAKELSLRSPTLTDGQLTNAVDNALAPIFRTGTSKGVALGKLYDICGTQRTTAPIAELTIRRD